MGHSRVLSFMLFMDAIQAVLSAFAREERKKTFGGNAKAFDYYY